MVTRTELKPQTLTTLAMVTLLLLFSPALVTAQQDKLAAFKQAMAQNQQQLRQYQNGPDGKVQKQHLSSPPQQQSPGGLKGKVVAKKKEELTDYMERAVVLVHSYVPPDQNRSQEAKDEGKISLTPGQGSVTLGFKNFVKSGDTMNLALDPVSLAIQKLSINSYLDSQKDAITLEAAYAVLPEGASHPGQITLSAPAKNVVVVVQNSNYQMMTPVEVGGSQGAPPGQAQSFSSQQLDQLTGSIALYPDALIAQILDASTNPNQVQAFAAWLNQNSGLHGSAVQDAAHKAGFEAPFVALAVFPQVVQIMAEKPDWTEQLGYAFLADSKAVNESIQRLRRQAQSVGNLKTTPQQQVVTQKSSSGEQVIVIQPANPQVVYVPQYNPQVVYVQSPPPPSSSSGNVAAAAIVGFTAGVIVGASSNNNYYNGPYAWYRPPIPPPYYPPPPPPPGYRPPYPTPYSGTAYSNTANLQQQRYNNATAYTNQRQDTYQQNASQRQSTGQANQAQRQSAAQGMQSTSSANQAALQSSMQNMQANSQANQAQRQSNSQGQQGQRASTWGGGSSNRNGMSSGGFSGYQSGATTQAQSQRGNNSLASSQHSGRRR